MAPFGQAPSGREPDLATIEILCFLQMAAHELGCRICVREADEELIELITAVGLAEVLLAPDVTWPS